MKVNSFWKDHSYGVHVKITEYRDDEGDLLVTEDRYFNQCDQVYYIREYNHKKKSVQYEEWREWYDNGELRSIRNTEGVCHYFDHRGLPIK
nr:MAG TPA: MORN repeat variant [Caudoviricetes sp.]